MNCSALKALSFLLLLFCFNLTAHAERRIVSLAPNLTEWVYAFHLQNELVAVTNECDFPKEVKSKNKVGSFIAPSLEKILSLKPTHVLVTEGNPIQSVERLVKLKIKVIRFDPKLANDLPKSIEKLGRDLGAEKVANEHAKKLENQLQKLREVKTKLRSFAVVIDVDPVYSVANNTWLGDLFTNANLSNMVKSQTIKYPVLSKESFLRAPPDHVFVMTSVLPKSLEDNAKRALWMTEKLFANKADVTASFHWVPKDILERPGPRLVEGISWLINTLKEEPVPLPTPLLIPFVVPHLLDATSIGKRGV